MTKLLSINFCTEQTVQTPDALLPQEDKEKYPALLFPMSANFWSRFFPTEVSMCQQSIRYSDLSAGRDNNPFSTLSCWKANEAMICGPFSSRSDAFFGCGCRTRPPDKERGYECSKQAVEERKQSSNLGAGRRTRANSLYNVSNGGQIWYGNLECLQRNTSFFSVTQCILSY